MLDVALSLSPRAEAVARSGGLFAAEGAVLLDASGISALHESESRFASVLHARAERAGLHGFVALAASRGLAQLAARQLAYASGLAQPSRSARSARSSPALETTRIVAPKQELAFLGPLPIDLLDPDDETAEALSRFGVHRIQDLLGLSRRDLAARVGPGILELVARARGEEIEPPIQAPRSLALEEGIDLESPLENLEPLAFVLRGLVSRLTERLALRALGCGELRASLRFEGGGRDERRIALASPCQDERVLLRLLRQALESKPPAAAIDGVTLVCEGVRLRREQLDLFLPRGPDPSQLDQTLAELGSICGSERVGSPTLLDDHRPDAFALRPFTGRIVAERSARRDAVGVSPLTRTGRLPVDTPAIGARSAARLTLRAVRPPARAEVRVEGGRPVALRSAVSQGEVVEIAGPWRTTGHWWSETGHFAVDHYDVQMSDGSVLRLCFDWRRNEWQVDGLYD
jgi:protein ImuB